MLANSFRPTPLKYVLKNWDSLIPQSLKRHTWSSVILNGQSSLWKTGNAGLLKVYNYTTILQLDLILRKQENVLSSDIYAALTFSAKHARLMSKGAVWCWLPPVLFTLHLYLGLPNKQAEDKGTLPGGCLSLVRKFKQYQLWSRLFRGFKRT